MVDGRVVTPAPELLHRIGTSVSVGEGVVDVVAPDALAARLVVPERFLSDVAIGMPVTLRFFKDPDVAYRVRIDAIEASVTISPGHPGALGMLSRLAAIGAAPPLGAAGFAKVEAGSQSLLGLLVRRAHRLSWVVFWSWW
ncbi:MAG TPA: HlyD family efflux transporter periplasmic adaptor subunit [Kofleriaceae bacterium]